jgi:hypothetical protein
MVRFPRNKRLGRLYIVPVFLLVGSLVSGCNSQEAANSADEMSYRKFLSINEVKSYYHVEPGTKATYPLLEGTLTNLGQKTLAVVEFTLRFKDNLHRVIYEDHGYPVYVSTLMGPSPTDALAPGQKVRFAFKAPKCPDSWQPGQVDIVVTKIAFLERKD